MFEKIQGLLAEIEKANDILILFAVENGSRAWKIENRDSDYDVRFVFVQKVDKYLQIDNPVEIINRFYNDQGQPCLTQDALMDVCGFDIFKYIRLLSCSNPTTIEWLISDIVYYGQQNRILKDFALNNFDNSALFHHYESICRKHYINYIKSASKITYKSYIYAFRGLINAKWVLNKNTIPPINFAQAMGEINNFLPDNIVESLDEILKLTSQGKGKDNIKNIMVLDEYIENFLQNNSSIPAPKDKKSIEILNEELRKIILNFSGYDYSYKINPSMNYVSESK